MSSDVSRRPLPPERPGSPVEVLDVSPDVVPPGSHADVHWGHVDAVAEPVDDRPRRAGRRTRWALVLGSVVAVLAVGAVGGLVLVEEDDGAQDVAQSYVSAWQRLDCAAVATLASDPQTGSAQCRFVRFRQNRFGEGRFGDRNSSRPRVQDSQFDLVGLDESAREAEARFDVEWSGGDAVAFVDLRRDEQARWRVISFRVGQPS